MRHDIGRGDRYTGPTPHSSLGMGDTWTRTVTHYGRWWHTPRRVAGGHCSGLCPPGKLDPDMSAYMYIYMYIDIFIHIDMYICMFIYIYIGVFNYIYICMIYMHMILSGSICVNHGMYIHICICYIQGCLHDYSSVYPINAERCVQHLLSERLRLSA